MLYNNKIMKYLGINYWGIAAYKLGHYYNFTKPLKTKDFFTELYIIIKLWFVFHMEETHLKMLIS